MSVTLPNYYTIREAIYKAYIDFSERHLKRLIDDQLKDENNNLVKYQIINGIRTIIIHISVFQYLKRRRAKSNLKLSKHLNTNLELELKCITEVTINFKNEFNKETLVQIFKNYPSQIEYKFVCEGKQNNRHIHMMVQDNTEKAKLKIESILNYYKIELEEVNLLIRPVCDFYKYSGYKGKVEEVIIHHNSLDVTEFESVGNTNYFKPYGTSEYNLKSVFNYKCNR